MKPIRFLFILLSGAVLQLHAQNVGIGTSNPLMKLHVLKSDSAVALFENTQTLNNNISNGIYFKTGNTGVPYTGAIKTTGQSGTTARLGFYTYASATTSGLIERVSITDAGDVGIGTTNPLNKLHLAGDEGLYAGSFNYGTFSNYNNDLMINAGRVGLFGTPSDLILQLTTGSGINQLRAGNVGIGTGSPTASLYVARGTANDGTAAFMGTTFGSFFNYSSSENTYIRGGKSASQVYINDVNTGDVIIGSGNGSINLQGSLIMPIRHADFSLSSDVYVQDNDFTLVIDFSNSAYNNNRRVILPSATGKSGVIYNLVGINYPYSGGVIASIIPGNTIPGPMSMTDNHPGFLIQSDGTNWYIINISFNRVGPI